MEPTPRARSSRSRRPPTQYPGTVNWKEAKELVKSEGQDERDNEAGDVEEEMEDVDAFQEGVAYNREDLENLSMDEDMDDFDDDDSTGDEFVPDAGKRKHDRFDEEDFGSDASSDQQLDLEQINTVDASMATQNELTTSQRLDRARKRRWHPPLGHGGMENFVDWKEAGQRKRELQKLARGDQEDDDADLEVEDEEIQNLAAAFAGDGSEATIAQVERWQSALHQDEEQSEEELDEAAFEQDIRGAVGFKRKAIRDRTTGAIRRAPRDDVLPESVRSLLTQANMSFIGGDVAESIAQLNEVIKLEPAVRSAWANLALCFDELKEPQKAMQSRIMEAHLTYRPIYLWEELAEKSKEMGYYKQAFYCLSRAISASREKDRIDVIDIMWERSQLLEQMNESRRAIKSYLQMLHYRPQNQSIIRQVVPLLYQQNMVDRAIGILQQCEEWNMIAFPDPLLNPTMMDENAGPDVRNTYESSEVVTLADLLLRTNRPQEALHTIRRGARWLDGRGSEEFWDNVLEDDREFDESREEDIDREGDYGRRVDMAPIHYLEPEFRFQIGVARARMGHAAEADYHFNIWKRDAHVSDHFDRYSEMAEEYTRLGVNWEGEEEDRSNWYQEALNLTHQAIHEREFSANYGEDSELILADYKRYATCYMALGDKQSAIRWLKEVLAYDPDHFETKLRLAEAYEDIGEKRLAIDLVNQVVKARRERQMQEEGNGLLPITNDENLASSLSFFAEAQQKSNRDGGDGTSRQTKREQRKERERIREMESNLDWKRLKSREEKVFIDHWWSPDVDMGGDACRRNYGDIESSKEREERFGHVSKWLSDAERLVTMFQNTSQLYPRNRTKKFSGVLRTKRKKADMVDSQATAILARLGDDYDDSEGKIIYEHSTFRGIKLDDWVTLIMQYAFILTKIGEYDTAQAVIERVVKSNVIWSDDSRKALMQLCLASCALYAKDYVKMVTQIKFLTFAYQFHNEPLRILLTLANAVGSASLSALTQPNNLKTFLRRSRIQEVIVQGGACTYQRTNKRWVAKEPLFESRQGEDVDFLPDQDEEAQLDVDEDEEQDNEERTSSPTKGEIIGKARDLWKDLQNDNSIDVAKATPPTRYNPGNDMFYASMILTSTNGVPSMGYWIRVFARQQNDPLICLTAAIACFGRAQNRQVDNRHQVILQAFTFLHHYRQIRSQSNDGQNSLSEVAYNFGRSFHRLGLYQLAVPHYQQVLQIRDKQAKTKSSKSLQRQTGFQAWPEAAYNLSLVYLASGNSMLANDVLEKYLMV